MEENNKIITYRKYLSELFPQTKTDTSLKGLIRDIKKIGNNIGIAEVGLPKDDFKYDEEFKKKKNEIVGGIFECFCMGFNHVLQNDSEVGLKNYKTTTSNNDYGVDFTGTNAIGTDVSGQIKFRDNPNDIVEYGDLCKTDVSARRRFKIDTDKPTSIWLITTGKPSHILLKEFGESLKVIDRDLISRKIQGKPFFWEEIHEYFNDEIFKN